MAMMCSALLAPRSPPLLRRWRVVFPEEAGTGLTPHSAAKLASDCRRSALSPAVPSNWGAGPGGNGFRGQGGGGKLVEMRDNNGAEFCDPAMQFKVAPAKRLSAIL